MIIGNYNIFSSPGRDFGGVDNPTKFLKGGVLTNYMIGDGYIISQTGKSSLYNSFLHPYSYGMPHKAGGIGSSFNLSGGSNIDTASIAGGLYGESNINGFGSISNAEGGLLAFLVANVLGSGNFDASLLGGVLALVDIFGTSSVTADINDGIFRINIDSDIEGTSTFSCDILAGLNATANINASSNFTAAITAIANLVAEILSEGELTQALLNAKANISANITPFTELSPQSLALSVWNQIASEVTDPLTMGGKLNLASSGGVDYQALANAVWDEVLTNNNISDSASTIMKKIAILAEEVHTLQGLNADNPATITKTLVSAGDINLELTGDGEELTVIQRV